jgi:plastocyanin
MPVTSFGNGRPLQIRYPSRGVMALIVGAAMTAATACGTSGSSDATASSPQATSSARHGSMPIPASPADVTAAGISITNFKYTVTGPVAPGATITVTNSDSMEHTVTADSGNAFEVEISDNGKATFTAPTQPGSYPFHCAYHPQMHGMLIVQ